MNSFSISPPSIVIACFASIISSLFPPFKDYDIFEIRDKCKKNGLNTKLVVTPINSSSETAYTYISGALIPISSTNYTFDIMMIDLENEEIIIRSTLKTEGDSIEYISSYIAKRIVTEMQKEEEKENNH